MGVQITFHGNHNGSFQYQKRATPNVTAKVEVATCRYPISLRLYLSEKKKEKSHDVPSTLTTCIVQQFYIAK